MLTRLVGFDDCVLQGYTYQGIFKAQEHEYKNFGRTCCVPGGYWYNEYHGAALIKKHETGEKYFSMFVTEPRQGKHSLKDAIMTFDDRAYYSFIKPKTRVNIRRATYRRIIDVNLEKIFLALKNCKEPIPTMGLGSRQISFSDLVKNKICFRNKKGKIIFYDEHGKIERRC